MKIAVIGGGISGMVVAYLLSQEDEVTLFEANDYIGGHTNTIGVKGGSSNQAVDTGFIVFNDWTYPNFSKLLGQLGVEWQPSDMSFSLQCAQSGLEYTGTSLNGLFVQRRNLIRPGFLRMVKDIFRFNREAKAALRSPNGYVTLDQFLASKRYSRQFVQHYLVPISSSIWSARPNRILDIPAQFFFRFMHNHGMLNINDRPQWRAVRGGSRRYVEKLIRPFRDSIRLSCPVDEIRRLADGVEIKPHSQPWESFDHVILAVHSDQALALLQDPSRAEREVLGAIPYQSNEVVLHTDTSLMPQRRDAWASWNYYRPRKTDSNLTLTYHMNRLQRLRDDRNFYVTLNRTSDIRPETIIRRLIYEHPVFSAAAPGAQSKHHLISGVKRTHYCGAYWGFGFHEDGVNSALKVCDWFGRSL